MRKRLDCVLLGIGQDSWARAMYGEHLAGRLQLHGLQQKYSAIEQMLADPAIMRGRYDAGLMYVDESSLRQWRTALAAVVTRPPTPLLVYAVGLRSQAIGDLLELGISDFMRPPFCPEELRARIQHRLGSMPALQMAENTGSYGATPKTMPAAGKNRNRTGMTGIATPNEAEFLENILERSGNELEAYAVSLAMQQATSRESFRAAKCQVVARFERAYIRAALGRYGGNITLAARMAQKHRRAFWALMRKHDIDPAPYRGSDSGP